MGLSILSKEVVDRDITLQNIVLAASRAKLLFIMTERAADSPEFIEINLKKYAAKKNIEESILFDIFTIENQTDQRDLLNILIDGAKAYKIAGTDNTPYRLCYDFSLAYLRLFPNHYIYIYERIFTLADLEKIESKSGFYENWGFD